MHPTCGILRDLGAFFWLRVFPTSQTLSTPTHTRVTQTVGWQVKVQNPLKHNLTEVVVKIMPKNIKKYLVITGIITLLITLLCSALAQFQRSGNKLFKVLILDPMPSSVIVLHSQDEIMGFGGMIWLHFKISPDDFNLVLKSKKWEFQPDFLIGADESEVSEIKDWWSPQSLGNNAKKYFVILKYDGHERVETIWVNSQRNEVYYQVVFIY